MQTTIRNIGNSKGVIIPAGALKEAGINEKVEMHVENDRIILQASKQPRSGWGKAIENDPPAQEAVFMSGIEDETLDNEWTW